MNFFNLVPIEIWVALISALTVFYVNPSFFQNRKRKIIEIKLQNVYTPILRIFYLTYYFKNKEQVSTSLEKEIYSILDSYYEFCPQKLLDCFYTFLEREHLTKEKLWECEKQIITIALYEENYCQKFLKYNTFYTENLIIHGNFGHIFYNFYNSLFPFFNIINICSFILAIVNPFVNLLPLWIIPIPTVILILLLIIDSYLSHKKLIKIIVDKLNKDTNSNHS